jgi:hypothetical protein
MTTSKQMKRREFLSGGSAATAFSLIPGCARAVTTTLYVEDYRRPGTSDRATIERAFASLRARGEGILEFEPSRTYRLGRLSNAESAFVLRDVHGAELRGNGARLVCESVRGQTQMFFIQRCSDLALRDFAGADGGADLGVEWKGMHFIFLETGAGPISRIAVDNVRVNGAVALLTCSGSADSPRASGIRLSNVVAENCYYGLSFQENGDDVSGDLASINCRRTYFPYGVRRHRIALDVLHDSHTLGADSCILIKRYARDTGDIDVRARFHGVLAWSNLVNLSQDPPPGETGVIENVNVQLSMDVTTADPHQAARLAFSAYSGGRQRVQSEDVWRNIRLSGCFGRHGASPVVYRTHAPRVSGLVVTELDGAVCA